MSREWLILTLASGGLGLWYAMRRRGSPWTQRLALVVLPVLLVALLYVYVETATLNASWTWSACRLAPVVGWLKGYPLYSPVDSGPINGWLYGPVAAVAWLPATLAGSPQPALFVAALINLLFLLLPLLGAARLATPDSWLTAGLVFAAAAAGLLLVYPTWYMASALNVDAIAVGLGAGSCLVLLSENPPGGRRIMIAALLSGLAAWTKQVEAPLVLAQLGWLGFNHGWKAVGKSAAAYAVTMLLVAGATISAWGVQAVVFNLWTVPSAHALPGGWTAARTEALDFFRYTWILWLPCVIGLWLRSQSAKSPSPEQSSKARHPLWLLLLAVVVLLPLGIMAAIKVGGDRNSIHSVYYLVVAAILALAGLRPGQTFLPPWLLPSVVLLASIVLTAVAGRQVASYGQRTMLPPRCLSEEAWLFARERPGHIYYPWDPLATLMAEGRMYHFEYGVLDRIYAGRAPDAARMRSDLPAKIDTVIYPRADYPRTMVKDYLKEFRLARVTEDWLIHHPIPPP